jgi:hypothetical protein
LHRCCSIIEIGVAVYWFDKSMKGVNQVLKFLKKRVLVTLLIPMMIVAIVFSPVFVNAVNGEIEFSNIIATLFGKAEKQEQKITDLEFEVAKLRDQLAQQTRTKNDDVEIPLKEKEETYIEKPVEETPDPTPEPVVPANPVTELKVKIATYDNYLKLSWTKETSEDLLGYKIVISKGNPSPSYPGDGYLKWITDRSTTSMKIDNAAKYNGGDFDGYLKPSAKYYVTVTYVYKDKLATPQPLSVTTPSGLQTHEPVATLTPDDLRLSVEVIEDHLRMTWTKEPSQSLNGYKLVISKGNAQPSYPDDGYLKWITDRGVATMSVDNSSAYNGGDIGGYLEPATEYYFSVTYVYGDKKVTSNVVKVTTPETMFDPGNVATLSPDELRLEIAVLEDRLRLRWTKEPSTSLQGYKVVIAELNPEPSYPADGYLTWITDATVNTFDVDNSTEYNNGDFSGYLKPSTEYYFSITYVYGDKKVTSNVLRVMTPPGLNSLTY